MKTDDYYKMCADEVKAFDKSRLYAVGAAVSPFVTWPLAVLGVKRLQAANNFYDAHCNVNESLKSPSQDKTYQEIQQRRDYGKVCYDASMKEAAIGTGYLLGVLLPAAFLA
ncbi:hypothetical protein L0152_09655, partial [bacterium]|nr:hypothetical protein [bacterium]